MQHIVVVAWAYVILEAMKFGYAIGWDIYANLGR